MGLDGRAGTQDMGPPEPARAGLLEEEELSEEETFKQGRQEHHHSWREKPVQKGEC